ncbi:hypothetical protein MQE36_01575 [Zhouia spongiae]|uniref:Cell surface protein SprA n=1 Tax=Zhouia spongiae TaxID=2202721 RepID=A0ABY3YNH9_9FLAO|nr:hypothetical protein [Zhouia spongiae]UNY99051.1 hypothetical protein MQE36_01575 [Zhouia spongiae]
MRRFLLLLVFLSYTNSYPFPNNFLFPDKNVKDSLVHNGTGNKGKSIVSKQEEVSIHEYGSTVSTTFLKALEQKFPESDNTGNYIPNAPEFSWEYIQNTYTVDSLTNSQQLAAKGSFAKIEEQQHWVDEFSNEDIVTLPVGVKYQTENVEYAIGITEAEINPDHTILTVFARVKIQQSDKEGRPIELFFGADNVKLSHQGGIIGDAKLVLLGDVPIPFNGGNWLLQLNGGFSYRSGNTRHLTYVTIDCSGVKNLALNGSVEFSRNMLIPIEKDGKVHENITTIKRRVYTEEGSKTISVPNRVRGDFNIVVDSWSDILVDISLQPFVRAKKRNGDNYNGNMQFYLNEAVLDFSDLRNSSNVHFPEYYHDNGLLMPDKNTWKGIYIETLEVRLPEEFKTKETIKNRQRIALGAHQFILDSYGLSGSFYADNLFTLEEGRTNENKAWAISLDHIEVDLAANHLIAAGFNGRVLLPVSDDINKSGTVGLRYGGYFSEEEYGLKVINDSIVDFGFLSAEGQLDPNSSIELKVIESQFRPKATLHGRLAINANQKKNLETTPPTTTDKKKDATVQFKGIEFQNLVLQTENPVFSVGYLGYSDEVKFANFPVSIANINISAQDNRAALWFDLRINLMDGAGFGAETTLGILAENVEEDQKQKWVFDGLDIQEIYVAANMGGFSFDGRLLLMQDDPEYGDGFAASLEAKFKSLGEITIKSSGIFGKTDGYRYWYFDAMIDDLAPPGSPGIIAPKGFGGGAYYKMKRKGFSSAFSTAYYSDNEIEERDLQGTGKLAYAPNENMGLGVKAMILFYVGSSGVLDGGAGFEILFNKHGGISRMGLYGQAKFMAELPFAGKMNGLMDEVKNHAGSLNDYMGDTVDNLTEKNKLTKPFLDKAELNFPPVPDKVGVEATMGIEYDFENSTLHGELDVYVNVAGGAVQGRASKGRAGWAVLHFAPGEWYIHMGTPTDRLGLKIGVGSFRVESGGYFMIGDHIPGSPPPPPIVAEILGEDVQTLDYMRDENALGEGRGFAFGADFSLDTGDLNFLILYARFQAGMGFDIMLKDYGEAACANRGGDQIGINGWYANGQSYAYLQGELGINLKLFFVRKKIPIIKGGAAVLLQAKAPNPVWMRGYVGGHFNLLGGLVKGKFRFKLTIGEECEFIDASPLGGMKIITDVTPKDGSGDVDVFAAPQATFSMKVNEPIVIPEDDGDKTYKIVLEKYRILHDGKEIPGTLEWGVNNDRATFVSTDILPPHQQLQVEVEVSFRERKNGVFETIMVDGQKAIETEIRGFTTGEAPTVIPLHNIRYAYPVLEQRYFMKNEYDKGYIQLLRGQDYLFNLSEWTTGIVFVDETGVEIPAQFNYNTGDNKVYYQLPNLSNNAKYRLSITSRTKASGTANDRNDNYRTTSIDDDNSVEVRQNTADAVVKEGEIERLAYDFATSKYNTFKQKVRNINTTDTNWGKIYSDVIFLANQAQSEEAFDLAELTGNEYTENKSLVEVTATLTDDYYKKDMSPPLYGQYPLGNNYKIITREEAQYGIPPKKAVPIVAHYLTSVQYNVNQNWLLRNFPYYYNLPLIYKQDWTDLRSQILNDWIDGNVSPSGTALQFLDADYLFMRYGNYTVNMQYILPGGIKGTSHEYEFKNENRFR